MKKNTPDTVTHTSPIGRFKGIFAKIPFCAVGGCSLLCLALGVLGYYILFPARGDFHSDCADTILWAQATYDGGALLNPDFSYACFLPIGGQLLMVPFIPLFGVSMTTHTIGMMLFLLLFTGALLFLFRQLHRSVAFSTAATGTVLLLMAGSEKLREIFFGHVIYYSLGLLFLFVGLGLVFRLIRALEQRDRRGAFLIYGSLLFIWTAMGAVNGFEILTLFSLPLLGALIAERFFDFSKTLSRRETLGGWILICGVVAATAIGYLLGNLIVGDMTADYATAYSAFSDPSSWFDNLSRFMEHYLTLFGVTVEYGQPLSDLTGILELLKMIAAFALMITPVVATLLYRKLNDRAMRILIWAHWIVTALVMMGFVFGLLSVANWRLSPLLCTSAVVTLALCGWCFRHRRSHIRLTLLALAPIAVVCVNTVGSVLSLPPDHKQDTGLYAVADVMTDNGWTYGYATFWNSNALTVISDSDVICRTIELSEDYDSYSARLYQSNAHWFSEPHDRCFVLLETYEYEWMVSAGNPLITDAVATHPLDGYVVLLFDNNIF